jgi:hypothetical protein
VQVVSTEPVWNNFNSAAVNALSAGQSLKQSFVFDGVGQSINENSNNVAIGGVLSNSNVAVGTGAGTGGTATLSGLDSAHILTIATGTLPTLSASVATVTYTANRGHVSYCSLTPANASTALLTGASMVFMSANSATAYTVTAGATALTASTTYAWNVTCP